jgi:hypothetical protein
MGPGPTKRVAIIADGLCVPERVVLQREQLPRGSGVTKRRLPHGHQGLINRESSQLSPTRQGRDALGALLTGACFFPTEALM